MRIDLCARAKTQSILIGRFAAQVALTFSLAACGGGAGGEPTNNLQPPAGDITAPTLTAVFPVDGAAQFATDAVLLATFSEAMDPATLTTGTFTLVAPGQAPVAGTVGVNGTTATFTPAARLLHNTQYTASITTGARDAAGNAMASAHAWSFTTAGAADTTPPTVSSTMPADGDTGVSTGAAVRATFSETMNPFTLNHTSFTTVHTATGNAVPGSIVVAGSSATFTPSASLAAATQYTVTIRMGAQDLGGNGLNVPYAWSFTTASGTSPGLGDSDLRFSRFGAQVTQVSTAPITTQTTGSVLVVGMANGSITSLQPPTDNKNNGYVQEGTSHNYALWQNSGTAMYVATALDGGANHVATGAQQLGEELTIAAIEVRNASRVKSVWREVLRSALPLTSADITTNGPAVLIAFWWGDADGSQAHTAVPNNGFTVVESVLLQGSLVQCAVAVRTVTAAGTYSVTWTSTPTQGAQLWLLAVE